MKRENFSRKRQAILQAVCGTDCHPTAEWVYQAVKPQYTDLSLGTVYRNLAKFKEEGLIASLGVINGQERFDGDTHPHDHFVCSKCGAILDVSQYELPRELFQALSERYSLRVDSHELIFRGLCPACLKEQNWPVQEGA